MTDSINQEVGPHDRPEPFPHIRRHSVRPILLLLSTLIISICLILQGSPAALATGSAGISAVWANNGEDKVTRDELRTVTRSRPVLNALWDGTRIRLFGARNEVLGFNLVVEASVRPAHQVRVRLDRLDGPHGALLQAGPPADPNGIFRWVGREIELFYVRYLAIKGLSKVSYETYDERHIPERFRRPTGADGTAAGGWTDRPDHDREYPDIAVPLELVRDFEIGAGTNQSIWVDLYIPQGFPPGRYSGTVVVSESGSPDRIIPVDLDVLDFDLPDVPTSKTMLFVSYDNIATRYTGGNSPIPGSADDVQAQAVLSRHMLLAHRHKISLIGAGEDATGLDQPTPEWTSALSGDLFTAKNGYEGPGAGVGNGIFSIGTYGAWQRRWGTSSELPLWKHTDGWEVWFRRHQPSAERFLYVADESPKVAEIERWTAWMKQNPGPGRELPSFATASMLKAGAMPSLDWLASTMAVGQRDLWQHAADRINADPTKRILMYNGQRPASGSFSIEDDGVALRELPWGQYKKGIARWFYWEGTYYNNYQGGQGETNVFRTAQTFGSPGKPDSKLGTAGWNYGNGDGVMFYPGVDRVFPADSYGLGGPIASLRLKYWRRGIQDVDYLKLAEAVAPEQVRAIVDQMVPKVLWENDVTDIHDPSWVRCPISWSTDPDAWEQARKTLARIILSGRDPKSDPFTVTHSPFQSDTDNDRDREARRQSPE